MRIELSKPFARNGYVDEYDVLQMKKILNRLGYYRPHAGTGITDTPDTEIFNALQSFQREHNLPATGSAKPYDETLRLLNNAVSEQEEGQYIWRTAGDDKVRPEHAALNGTVRDLSETPDPGEDYNCRCWMDLIIKKSKCDRQEDEYKEAKKVYEDWTKRKEDTLNEIKSLAEEAKSINQDLQKLLTMMMGSHTITIPIAGLPFIGEILREMLGNAINNALMDKVEKRGKELAIVYEKIDHKEAQLQLILFQLENARIALETAMLALNECRLGTLLE